MNFKPHFQIGMATSIVMTLSYAAIPKSQPAIDHRELLLVFLLCLFGSLFPDLDTQSTPSRIVSLFGVALSLFSIYYNEMQYAVWFCLIFCAVKAQKHRGITHSYLLVAACLVFAFISKSVFPLSFAVGLVCHYILDNWSNE